MGDRVPFVVGLLAIVAVVAVLVLRGETAQPPANPAPVPETKQPSQPPPSTPQPKLPANVTPSADLPPAPSAEQTFSDENRDAAWATPTEAEIKKRWTKVRGGKLDSLECRQTQCKLVVKGSEDDVAAAIADLEGPRGMHGFAQNVLLTSPQKHDDGSISLSVFVRFER